ncbi:asparagine synthase (glutamine-hydrolysing) [Gammaproteobacteria bacterium]
MCGICGEFRFEQGRPDLAAVGRMTEALKRRGPDHEGIWVDGPVAFGQRRLAVIDLSSAANQPMVDPELALSLVFNGTLYNYPELRQELISVGYHFFSHGDTEVLLKAYHRWGEACVGRFHGVFAFAIWDIVNQKLFLARDRLGIKPLYWTAGKEYLRFASSTQALLVAGHVDTKIDPVSLHFLFTLHAVVPAPRTLLTGVRKVPPAHTLTTDASGNTSERCYWTLHSVTVVLSEQEWAEKIYNSLLQAVRKRLTIADVPVGVLLSGGLDSSLLVALLSEAGVQPVRTFSIGFEGTPEESGSEFEYSDLVVKRFQTRHQRILLSNREVLPRLPETMAQMSEPMFAQDAVAFYLLAEKVSREVKVVQSGQGADEVFGGYFWYPRMASEEGAFVERFRKHYFDRDHIEYLEMISPDFHSPDWTSEYIAGRLEEPGAYAFMDQVFRLDATTLIVDDPVKRVDNMTMAWGLEARVPFLDHTLVELAASMPTALKIGSGGKHILKNIARGRLPETVIDRPKGYFPVPALKYVRGEFFEFVHDLLCSRVCRERGLYSRKYVDYLLAAREPQLTRIQGNKLWHLAALELWLQVNLDQAVSS